ncbi:MAG: efflux RND transporter periplasmic adaptor subunit [Gemmatimonadaceae bacterium]|nr:efflux RND transporter periplasmic adaptor subunit [Gloeobacterales cyanobacterium ES-bin-141]
MPLSSQQPSRFSLFLFLPLALMNFNRSANTVAIAVLLLGFACMPAVAEDAGATARAAHMRTVVEVPSDIQKALGLKVLVVREQVLGTGVAANGQIQSLPDRTAQINAPVAGRVLRLAVQSGQPVKTGQMLVVLDSPEIRQLAVEQERVRAESRAQVNAAGSRVNLAKSTYEREKELVALKISARKDFQVAEAELRQAEAELAVARSRLQLSGSALRSRLAGLGQGRALADGSVVLTSPLSGVVTRQQVTAGEAVEPGKTLFDVVNTTQVWATAQVYEKDLGRIRIGQSIEVVTQSYPGRTFKGAIQSIDPVIDPETRTLAVRAVLDNPQGLLKPQMFATLRLVTGQGKPVIVVPSSAVLNVDGKTLVYIQNGDDAFEAQEVVLGTTVGDSVEVKKGVQAGDKVVSERAFQLRAQDLKSRGASFGGDEHGSEDGENTDQTQASEKEQAGQTQVDQDRLPGWLWALGALVLAALAFVSGLQVASRRGTPLASPTVSSDSPYNS